MTEVPIPFLASCAGKQSFASANLAHKVAKRRMTRGYISDAYRCRHCNQWHIGKPIDRNWRRREATN